MLENDANNMPSQNGDLGSSVNEYLQRAAQAVSQGNETLALHLYLAAFERGQAADGNAPSEAAIDGLKRAWRLACSLKERSIAEYVFERMEPYLSSDEVAACAEQLQELALSKLEEFGLSRDELEDMTDMISQGIMGGDAHVLRVEHLTAPSVASKPAASKEANAQEAQPQAQTSSAAPADASPAEPPTPVAAGSASADAPSQAKKPAAPVLPGMTPAAQKQVVSAMEHLTYKDLVGYDDAVRDMSAFGIGMQKDAEFQELVKQLNVRHGLDRMPACDALLLRAPAREDANRFMMATVCELGLPVLRMRMEENMQGMPVLCVMAQADNQPKLNNAHNAFEGPGVLVIEDIDLWSAPVFDSPEDIGGLIMSTLSRGAREAVNLIRNSADNPDVFVLCTAAADNDIDPFFFDLLGPLSAIEIDNPNEKERADIWMEIAREHPSIRGVNRDELVKYTQGMPRYDIYMAAREAIEEAYKTSLLQRRYVPVTTDNLYDKLAAYQPLDSQEYKALEQAVVDDFRRELDHLDDLLKGDGK